MQQAVAIGHPRADTRHRRRRGGHLQPHRLSADVLPHAFVQVVTNDIENLMTGSGPDMFGTILITVFSALACWLANR